jgi:hypothetical protein
MSPNLIRFASFLAALSLSACSTYQSTVTALDSAVTAPTAKIPHLDLTNATWQKLTPDQPESNPIRVAIVERNDKIGAVRVVLKAPAAFTLPPYWLTAQGNYTVLKGTFVFETLTAGGKRTQLAQPPGTFAEIPKHFIMQTTTRPGTEGLLYITVYGEWAPKVAEGAWTQQTARAN